MPATKKLSLAEVIELFEKAPFIKEMSVGDIRLVRGDNFSPPKIELEKDLTPPTDPLEAKKFFEDLLYQSSR